MLRTELIRFVMYGLPRYKWSMPAAMTFPAYSEFESGIYTTFLNPLSSSTHTPSLLTKKNCGQCDVLCFSHSQRIFEMTTWPSWCVCENKIFPRDDCPDALPEKTKMLDTALIFPVQKHSQKVYVSRCSNQHYFLEDLFPRLLCRHE